MDTAEMRLLTVPQFARRVHSSVDEVLALIASRDVKALRPDPEGGYRVLETEVDRLLQERMTRIKRPVADGAPRTPSILEPPALPELPAPTAPELEPTPARQVAMETYLTAVTTLEASKDDNARLERLNANLQAELFGYRQLLEQSQQQAQELRAELCAVGGQLETVSRELSLSQERCREAELGVRRLESLAEEARLAEAARAASKRSFWQRLFG